MKLKLLLIGLVCCATAANAATAPAPKAAQEKAAPVVSDTQVNAMKEIMGKITRGAAGGPEELFKIINGNKQTTDREVALSPQSAVAEAAQKRYSIVCYEEGKEKIAASTDPVLLEKEVAYIKNSNGESVRDLAIKAIGSNDEAVFTYTAQPDANAPMVNGKPLTHDVVAAAAGRNAFKDVKSEKKFLCIVTGRIDN